MSAYKYEGFNCIASGGSASINSTLFWVCRECGATITTTTANYIGDESIQIHRDWHAKQVTT